MDFLPSLASIWRRSMKKNVHLEPYYLNDSKTSDLSIVIDKLYAWEEKLLKEVQNEEKLRVEYDKKFEKLQRFLRHGEEDCNIRSAHYAVREVLTRIYVSIKSIESISMRIQKLRDENLRFQLVHLIQGYTKMWNSFLDCHQKQYKAIADSKTSNLTLRSISPTKAIAELEQELMKWSNCFDNLIKTQIDYAKSLHGWLMMFLDEEPEVTPDGVVPFSPGRIGAPPVFVISHDWCQALQGVHEDVSLKMNSSAMRMQKLLKSRLAEHEERLRVESLLSDYNRMSKSDDHCSEIEDDGNDMRELDLMWRRLVQVKEKHKLTVMKVREETSRSLRTSLVPIFDALGCFILETLKAYDDIRINHK